MSGVVETFDPILRAGRPCECEARVIGQPGLHTHKHTHVGEGKLEARVQPLYFPIILGKTHGFSMPQFLNCQVQHNAFFF